MGKKVVYSGTVFEAYSICGMATQLKQWIPSLMLESLSLQKLCAHSVQFYWSQDLEKEWLWPAMENVKLFPLDVEKAIVMYTDAAQMVVIAYILSQFKFLDNKELGVNIVQTGIYSYLGEIPYFWHNVTKK